MDEDDWFDEFECRLRPASERQARLAAAAACRRGWRLIPDPCHLAVIEAAERLADGESTEQEFQEARGMASARGELPSAASVEWGPEHYMTAAARHLGSRGAAAYVFSFAAGAVARTAGPRDSEGWLTTFDAEGATVLAMLADILGPSTRPSAAHPEWLTPTVASLAAGIYSEHAFDRLPILADALQDAGCEDELVLEHCRGPGPHVRGCWAVDLVLGKEPPGAPVAAATPPPEAVEDPFAESDARLAAQVRQMSRAHQAGDAEAVAVEMTFFEHSLTLTVRRQLQLIDHVWDGARRWFDGLAATPEFPLPNRLRLRGEICWVIGQEHWYHDPFDFEMELCPTTGAFRSYVIRFGDDRPLSAKVRGSASSGAPCGEWAFVIERRRAEPPDATPNGDAPGTGGAGSRATM